MQPSIEEYATVFHNSSEPMSITTVPEGRFRDVSDEFAAVFGLQRAEVIGKTTTELGMWAEPSARESFLAMLEQDGLAREVECRLRIGTGEVREFWVSGRTIEWDDTAHMVAAFRDITDRKLVEASLLESEDRFRRIVESSPMGIFLYDLEPGERLVFRGANHVANAILGVDCSQFIGKTIEEAFPPLDATDVPEKYRRAAASGERSQWEQVDYEHGVISGAFEVYAFQTKPNSMACLFLDIAERKQAERDLMQSEQQHRTLFETMTQGVVYRDRGGQVVSANPAATEILGLTLDQLRGQTLMDPRWKIVREDGSDLPGEEYPALVSLSTGKPVLGQVMSVFNPSENARRWIVVDSVPMFRQGEDEPYQVYTTFTDVTNRRRADRMLLDIAKGVSASTGESFFRELVSHLATALDADYALVGKLVGENRDRVETIAVCADGTIVENIEYALAGSPCWKVVTGSPCVYPTGIQQEFPEDLLLVKMEADGYAGAPMCDSQDRVLGVLAVLYRGPVPHVDVAKSMVEIFAVRAAAEWNRLRAQEERQELEAQLLHAQRMESIGRLAGGVAHDFNNLLMPMMNYAEMLGGEFAADDPRSEYVAQVQRAARRARDLTRQLLALGRKQVLEVETIQLSRVLADTENMLRRTVREDIAIEFAIESSSTVKADVSQIEQVLMNLVVNAQDAMPGGGKLLVEIQDILVDETYAEVHSEIEPGVYVLLAVSDTGVGMNKETLDRVFEPFFTTKEVGKGTGLGLATAYGIVKQHGGWIVVYSEPDQGTKFSVYLPRSAGSSDLESKPEARRTTGGGSEFVLVVEDDTAVRDLTCDILRRYGYSVTAARNGDHCLELVETMDKSPQLLLTDIVMPGMNGRALYERLNPLLPGMKVLFMSGYSADMIDRHGILESGMKLIRKPFTMDGLAHKVRTVLDDKHAESPRGGQDES